MKTIAEIEIEIDSINWTEKEVCGWVEGEGDNAGIIPQALKMLMKPDEKIQDKAFDELDNYVVVQRNLYEASYYVLPILFSMLECDEIPEKNVIFGMIDEISRGSKYDTVGDSSRTIVLSGGKLVNLEEGCRDIFEDKIGVLLRLLKDSEAEVRALAVELLTTMPYLHGYWLDAVVALGKTESDKRIMEAVEDVETEVDEFLRGVDY